MRKKHSARVYKNTIRFGFPKNLIRAGGAIVGIILLFLVFTNSAPSQAESSSPTSPSRTTPPEINSKKAETDADTAYETIPLCTRATSKFGGIFTCELRSESSTVHYEYLESLEQILAISQSYELKNDPTGSPFSLRTGIVEEKSRLVGIDTTSQTVIEITSNVSEKTLKQWWKNYMTLSVPQGPAQ